MPMPSTIPDTGDWPKGRGRGLCRGCLRDLFLYGDPGSRYCGACLKSKRTHPDVALADMRNGRSEILPAERPIADGSWRASSFCWGAPLEPFESADTAVSQHVPRAAYDTVAQYCAHCPVLDQCGAEADDHEYPGVWGGAYRYSTSGRSGKPVYRSRNLVGVKPPERDRHGRRHRERAARSGRGSAEESAA